jgi:hypothetical protein
LLLLVCLHLLLDVFLLLSLVFLLVVLLLLVAANGTADRRGCSGHDRSGCGCAHQWPAYHSSSHHFSTLRW